ncbi:MAG: ATP-binding cassette domain-containing protein [Bacteroidia bacterium]|nr:ATP-binding cassette domain-containing protein [Bacteroidia bacterium]MCF8428044.1 ATP-binding cassette domain-containing protein [Bacteroidia bacterium]MCF8447805.1 ATP-binding cassette domain-containing protein [Bacteroidia bacterium]
MKISLQNIGKKFNRKWVFKGIHFSFETGSSHALVGNNGSGKSTLLQVIYNFQTFTAGEIIYELNGKTLAEEELVGKMAFAAPYLDLFEEFSLLEMLQFHFSIVPLQKEFTFESMLASCNLAGHEDKPVKHFSSGMKQRLKLLMAICADTPVLLLDEPCSNLDEQGINWYRSLVQTQLKKRTILIASNQSFEYDFCEGQLSILDFKPEAISK